MGVKSIWDAAFVIVAETAKTDKKNRTIVTYNFLFVQVTPSALGKL
jgi:hypothetical protein